MSVAESSSIERIQALVAENRRIRPVGGGSKDALSHDGNLSLKELSGVLEYEPAEYTFTALAGTKVVEVEQLLAANGQYLPFDPPLGAAGATLGGTVASGLSGPGRFRYGGVRDFLLGVRFVNGEGQVVSGGGKVVKNSAGFDLPKLMVGSLGRYGVLTELTFKVFPRPEAYASLVIDLPDPDAAQAALRRLASSPFELTCLDLEPPSRLTLRIGGVAEVLPKRLARLQHFLGHDGKVLDGNEDEKVWSDARNFGWRPPGHDLIKVPLTPGQIPELERALAALDTSLPPPVPVPGYSEPQGAVAQTSVASSAPGSTLNQRSVVPRRYSVAGHVAWLAWPETLPAAQLEAIVSGMNRAALALTGKWADPVLGKRSGAEFARRLLSVLDADGKFDRTP